VGAEGSATRDIAEGTAAFEVERVESVATLRPAEVAAVVLVLPAVEVSVTTAVERTRRVHGRTPVVVATDEVRATRADTVVPLEADSIEHREMHDRKRYWVSPGNTEADKTGMVEIVDPVENPTFCANCHRMCVTHNTRRAV